jgi:hypothetical protein
VVAVAPVGGASLVPVGVGLASPVLVAPLVPAPAAALVGVLLTAPLALHAATAATLATTTAHAAKRARR